MDGKHLIEFLSPYTGRRCLYVPRGSGSAGEGWLFARCECCQAFTPVREATEADLRKIARIIGMNANAANN